MSCKCRQWWRRGREEQMNWRERENATNALLSKVNKSIKPVYLLLLLLFFSKCTFSCFKNPLTGLWVVSGLEQINYFNGENWFIKWANPKTSSVTELNSYYEVQLYYIFRTDNKPHSLSRPQCTNNCNRSGRCWSYFQSLIVSVPSTQTQKWLNHNVEPFQEHNSIACAF